MANLFANYATGRLLSAINTVDATITLEAGQGVRFPEITGGDHFWAVLEDTSGNFEIVRVTTHAAGADSMVVTRGQDGTLAQNFAAGSAVEIRMTRAMLAAFLQLTGGTLTGPLNGTAITLSGALAAASISEGGTALVSKYMALAGDQSVAGIKTFSSAPVLNAGLNIGHASDTTLTRLSAGTLAVEGVELSKVGHVHAAANINSGTFADARIAASNVTQHQAALALSAAQVSADITSGTVNVTLAAGHAGDVHSLDNASARTITVGSNALGGNGKAAIFVRRGAGAVTFVASGVTLRTKGGLAISSQHGAVGIVQLSTTEFQLVGDL